MNLILLIIRMWFIRTLSDLSINFIDYLIGSIFPLLAVYYLWHRYEQPSLKFSRVGWDDWVDDRRYFLEVKNRGRIAAKS